MYNAVVFGIFTRFGTHHHCLIPNYFHHTISIHSPFCPPSSPWWPVIHILFSQICLFWTFNFNGFIKYVAFWVFTFTYNVLKAYSVWHIYILHWFLCQIIFCVWIYHILKSIYQIIAIWIVSTFFTTVNNTAMNIHVTVYMQTYFFVQLFGICA